MADSARRSNRNSLLIRITIGAGFLILLFGISIWLIHGFIARPQQAALSPSVAPTVGVAAPAIPHVTSGSRLNAVFTGRVVDAKTQQPIKEFTARIALGNSTQPNSFQDPKQFTNGNYELSINAVSNRDDLSAYVRIDAAGYLPATSGALSASTTQDFQLAQGRDLQGRVLTPDSTPAVNAAVAIASRTTSVQIADGNLVSRGIQCRTDATGAYDLPPQTGTFALAAISPDGYAEVEQGTIVQDPTIHLESWGQINGHLFIGTKAGAGETIACNAFSDPGKPRISHQMTITTDAAGAFQFVRVPPGVVRVIHMVPTASGISVRLVGSQRQIVKIAPGQTTTLKIGGTGRPIVGRIVLPPAMGSLTDYLFSGNLEKLEGDVPLVYGMQLQADGTFRVDDVTSGNYRLTILGHKIHSNATMPATTTMDFTMPNIPGGVSDNPLEMPDIQVNGQ